MFSLIYFIKCTYGCSSSCMDVFTDIKKGNCPKPNGYGTCDVKCLTDGDCDGLKKCVIKL